MVPGRITFAVIPASLFSSATVFISDTSAAFDALYAPDLRAGILGSAAADCDDAAASSLAHVRQNGPQNVESAIQIQVEHPLEGFIVSVRDGLAAGEGTDEVGQNVNSPEACDDSVNCLLRGIEAGETRGERGEIRMVKVGLLDVRGQADDRGTSVKQGFGNVRSESAAGSGDEGDLPITH
jgi:hypothetical protein